MVILLLSVEDASEKFTQPLPRPANGEMNLRTEGHDCWLLVCWKHESEVEISLSPSHDDIL